MSGFDWITVISLLLFGLSGVMAIIGFVISELKHQESSSKVADYEYDITEHENYWREYL